MLMGYRLVSYERQDNCVLIKKKNLGDFRRVLSILHVFLYPPLQIQFKNLMGYYSNNYYLGDSFFYPDPIWKKTKQMCCSLIKIYD